MFHFLRFFNQNGKGTRHSKALRLVAFYFIWSIIFIIYEYFVPLHLDSLNINYFMIGVIISGSALTSFFISPFLGYIQRRLSPRILLCIAVLLFGLAISIFMGAGSFIIFLFIASNIYGVSFDLFTITSYKSVFENSVEGDRCSNISFLESVHSLGLLIGAIIAGFIVSSYLDSAVYLCLSLLVFLLIVVIFDSKAGRLEKTGAGPTSFFQGHKDLFFELKNIGKVGIFLIILQVFLHLWDGFFFVFEPLFAQKFQHYFLSEEIIGGFILAIYVLPIIICEPFFGKLEDKFDRKFFVFAGLAIGSISIYMLQISDNIFLSAASVFLLSFGFYSIAMPAIEGMYESLTEGKFGKKYCGMTASIMENTLNIGFFFGPLVGGLFINSQNGFNHAFKMFAFFTFIILVLSFLVLKEKKIIKRK